MPGQGVTNTVAQLGVNVETNDAQVQSEFERMVRSSERWAQETSAAGRQVASQTRRNTREFERQGAVVEQSVKRGIRGQRAFRSAVGNMGHQVQDVAVQLQYGTDALIVFGQQGSQIAAAFGPTGAIVGGVVAIGAALGTALVPRLLESAKTSKEAEEAQEALARAYSMTGGEIREVSDELSMLAQVDPGAAQIQMLGGIEAAARAAKGEVVSIRDFLNDRVDVGFLRDFEDTLNSLRRGREQPTGFGIAAGQELLEIQNEARKAKGDLAELGDQYGLTGDDAERFAVKVDAFLRGPSQQTVDALQATIGSLAAARPQFALFASDFDVFLRRYESFLQASKEIQEPEVVVSLRRRLESFDIPPEQLAREEGERKALEQLGPATQEYKDEVVELNKAVYDRIDAERELSEWAGRTLEDLKRSMAAEEEIAKNADMAMRAGFQRRREMFEEYRERGGTSGFSDFKEEELEALREIDEMFGTSIERRKEAEKELADFVGQTYDDQKDKARMLRAEWRHSAREIHALIGGLFSGGIGGALRAGRNILGRRAAEFAVESLIGPIPGLPRRQHGGPVEQGKPYIVGERSAEVFGDRSGHIDPDVERFRQPPPEQDPGGERSAEVFVPDRSGHIDPDVERFRQPPPEQDPGGERSAEVFVPDRSGHIDPDVERFRQPPPEQDPGGERSAEVFVPDRSGHIDPDVERFRQPPPEQDPGGERSAEVFVPDRSGHIDPDVERFRQPIIINNSPVFEITGQQPDFVTMEMMMDVMRKNNEDLERRMMRRRGRR